MSRLKDRYQKDVMPALKKEFGYKNVMAIPKIDKVVINMGLGEATGNAKQTFYVDRPNKQIVILRNKRCQCDV